MASEPNDEPATIAELAARVAGFAVQKDTRVAVAESLTSGMIAQSLGAAADASTWFAGGVIAYRNETKQRLLGVRPGPVMTAACAEQMARGVLELTGAGVSAAVTGVGGPGSEEGQAAGTVFIAVAGPDGCFTSSHALQGPPERVLQLTTTHALMDLQALLTSLPQRS